MANSGRKFRVGEMLQACIGEELLRFNDPRITGVVITEVDVSPDLKSARVFWSPSLQINSQVESNELDQVQLALINATGAIKKKIGQKLQLRYVPSLKFINDKTATNAARIEELLGKAKEQGGNDTGNTQL